MKFCKINKKKNLSKIISEKEKLISKYSLS
jgi:hypothetical protein